MSKNTLKVETPACCGRPMDAKVDLGRVWEAVCEVCGDVIYIKKEVQKPRLLDD